MDEAFFVSLAQSSTIYSIHYWCVVLLQLASVGVIVTFFLSERSPRPGLLACATVVGIVGASLATADFVSVGVAGPRLAERSSGRSGISGSGSSSAEWEGMNL